MASASVFSFASDRLLAGALATGLGALLASGLLVGAIVTLRFVRRLKEADARAVIERWRPRFVSALAGTPPAPHSLRHADAHGAIALLHELMLGIKGEGRGRLAAYARACGLEDWARRYSLTGRVRERLPAIAVLGHMESSASLATLERIVVDPNPVLSLAAARSTLAIDTARTAARVVQHAIAREDWPGARVLAILQDSAHEAVGHAVLVAFETVTRDRLVRLLSFARVVPAEKLWPVLHRLLETADMPEILSRTLRLVADPREAPRVRALLHHPEWIVRLAAVQALGRIATEADLPRLTTALSDSVWWVRQRAADALVRLPYFSRAQLERLHEVLSDRYARDALARAMAENSPA
ncbi:MAG: HEAT repeat domain-containing protein [Betaproteobacteria bacterium]|nr:HEAT repeat domain-containing protein [Betaproteobacteria bacterium]